MSDDTGEFFPFRDENENAAGNQPNGRPRKDDDQTRMMPPTDAEDDATQLQRPVSGDATTVQRPVSGDATAVYRPADDGRSWAEEDEIWAGRAGVRAPGPQEDATGTDWAGVPPEEPRGKWWTPILVGIVALILLALLGWGIYLIVQSSDDGDSPTGPGATPSQAPPAATATTPAPAETPPTTTPTTTTAATTKPTSSPPSSPSDVTIPALRGLSLDEAKTALNRKNLNYRLRYVASTDAPPGTVIGSDPAEGQQVPDDTIVNLIIASEPTATTTPPTSTTTPTSEFDED
ncbi:PASTA domain-containing protein [Actinoplanes sp. TFC3]|uniref:PASTA domain-containing protein n=1 Tax=Actinoplanes sp. TFC3 TaxID=1710355 RepID=UPI00082DCAC6|nr:PASTA domain-containing protein [Actinoplanes sp. TFC3]